MSDEDRRDSDLLNSVVKKKGRNLTDEEQAVLDRYGIDYSDGLGVFQGKDYPRRLSWLPGDYVDGKPVVNGKVNIADKVRKDMSGERDYAKSVWADGRVGDTFDKQERDYQNRRLQHDYATVSSFIGDRRHADIMGTNHDIEARRQRGTQKAYRDLASTETDQYKKSAYLQTADDADAMADYHETQRDKYRAKFDRLNKGIEDIKDKYRRKNESIKGLRRRNKSFSEGFNITKRYYALVSYWDNRGDSKDKLIEDDTVNGVVRKLRKFFEKNPDISEINRVSRSVDRNEEYQRLCSEYGVRGHSIDLFT